MIFAYQTPMCDKAIQQLKDSGLFDNEIFDNDIDAGFCYEIREFSFGGYGYDVPHGVYWSPNKCACFVGYTSEYIRDLCRKDKIKHYKNSVGYQLPVSSLIELRKRYLARKKSNN